MSENIYFWNRTKKEYVYGYGNHNRSDTLRSNYPIALTWLFMNDWNNDIICCIGDSQNSESLLKCKEKTNYYLDKYNKSHASIEHGKLNFNNYAKQFEE